MNSYTFTKIDNESIIHLLDSLKLSIENNKEEFIIQCKEKSKELPEEIKKLLDNFVKNGSKTGYLLLENVNTNELLEDTPSDNTYFIGEKTQFAKVITLLNEYLGEMIAYEGEGYGRLFQDMVPKKTLSNTQTSLGSNVELEIHTEQAFSKLRPDILTLGCLRSDIEAKTYIFPVRILLEKMEKSKIQMLREPLWKIGVDLSFKINFDDFIEGDCRGPLPILYGSEEDPFFVFDQDLMKGINDQAEKLKNEIIQLYYDYRYTHILKEGEILFIDNRRAVHGRSPFTPKYDGKDRFIIRSFLTLNYDDSNYARKKHSRVVEAKYS